MKILENVKSVILNERYIVMLKHAIISIIKHSYHIMINNSSNS